MNKQIATIDLIEGTVNKVSKVNKPYSATVLHYTVNGERKEKMVIDRGMRDHITQNFYSGDTVVLSWDKNEKGYLDLVGVEKDDGTTKASPPVTNTTSHKQVGSNDREVGMQVGNALTNAATLMAAGVVTGTLIEVASMVIQTGEMLKAKLLAGEL